MLPTDRTELDDALSRLVRAELGRQFYCGWHVPPTPEAMSEAHREISEEEQEFGREMDAMCESDS